MKNVANLLFEIRMLKSIPRSGYGFLGNGKESVAEHSFIAATIGFALAQLEESLDTQRLISMCLLHDLAEARIGDLNYVQKQYVRADEVKAIKDATAGLPFAGRIRELVEEFNRGESLEAKLARDADQIAFVLDLKALNDSGYARAEKWLDYVMKRLQTDTGRKLAETILDTHSDEWWLNNYVDTSYKNN
jgi:putative hydrolase of HD superfamily